MNLDAEWLEADGRGGFASGTVGGIRTRRYHAALLTAVRPPVARVVLVNGFDAYLESGDSRLPLSTQCYAGGGEGETVLSPRGLDFIVDFRLNPWPRWTYEFPGGLRVEQELFIHQATGIVALNWKLLVAPEGGTGPVRLVVCPLCSGRDYHNTHHENSAFNFSPADEADGNVGWQFYPNLPLARFWTNGSYRHDPAWYRNFYYAAEKARGLDYREDLAAPGAFVFELGAAGQEALMLLGAGAGNESRDGAPPAAPPRIDAAKLFPTMRQDEEKRRAALGDGLARSADAYVVWGERGPTIIAGYPWFTDWGRDTFISLRGLCLAMGRWEEAREILLGWTDTVSEGMLPNRFPDSGEEAVYNSVDASLWFVVAVHDYLALAPRPTTAEAHERHTQDSARLLGACETILEGYAAGTRFGIYRDPEDGLLAAGAAGVALTWMDVVIDGRAITPRTGKAVEIQALWINALYLAALRGSARWLQPYEQARTSFSAKFWNAERGCLFDVVDCHGQAGINDASLRPNQVFAIGGLPLVLLTGAQSYAVMQTLERELLTPLGLRTLAPGEPGYHPTYGGGPVERDTAYHQGTVWPWLLGPYVEAWVRLQGDTAGARSQALKRFVEPLLAALPAGAGLGHLTEVASAQAPFTPGGCPFQAWSVGEFTRIVRQICVTPPRAT